MSAQLLRHCTVRRLLSLPCHRRSSSQAALALLSLSTDHSHPETSPGRGARPQDTLASQNAPQFTKAESYLASIQAIGLEPTLVDAEKFRPARHSRPNTSKYADEYRDLIDTLCRAFSRDQLRRFTVLYKLDSKWTRANRRKVEYAESIIEHHWGWPSLKEIEKRRIDKTEVVSKRFPVTASELFLILGKDGADLLQLSIQYNVHISLASDPLALQVEGLRGTLKQLSEHIDTLKKGIRHEIFELPTRRSIPPDLIQRISRLAGAYVENYGGEGKIRIFAKNISNMHHAERLAIRASLEEGSEVQANIICHSFSQVKSGSISAGIPHDYYLYPFLTPNPFPWTMQAGRAFRIRRVADWLGLAHEDIMKSGGLADNEARFMHFTQEENDLRRIISKLLDESSTSEHKSITASLGHLLLSSGENPHQPSLLPPLRGRMPLPPILKWLQSAKPRMTFVPSFPISIPLAFHSQPRTFHRLVYRTLRNSTEDYMSISATPSQVISFEMELIPLPSANTVDSDHYAQTTPSDMYNTSAAQCQIGKETILNLMVPNSPVDLQFSVLDCRQVPEERLPQLSNYHNTLRDFTMSASGTSDRPYPPPAFDFEGHTYYLYDTWSLQQRIEHIIPTSSPDNNGIRQRIPIAYEKVLDLEGGQQLQQCKVKFDPSSDMTWKNFLAACDQLMAPVQSRSQEERIEYSR